MYQRHIRKDSGSGTKQTTHSDSTDEFSEAERSQPVNESSTATNASAGPAATEDGSTGLTGRLAGGLFAAASGTASYGWSAIKWTAGAGAAATGAVASRLPVVHRFAPGSNATSQASSSGSKKQE